MYTYAHSRTHTQTQIHKKEENIFPYTDEKMRLSNIYQINRYTDRKPSEKNKKKLTQPSRKA